MSFLDQQGFDCDQSLYHYVRADYPKRVLKAIRDLGVVIQDGLVLDVGSGTGKLAVRLAEGGAKVIALDLSLTMLSSAKYAAGFNRLVRGRAELLPFKDNVFSIVSAGQSFHWFQTREVLDEIHRTLIKQGWLVLIWNIRNRSCRIARKIDNAVGQWRQDAPRWQDVDWVSLLKRFGKFEWSRQVEFPWIRAISADQLIDSAMTRSYVAKLPAEMKMKVKSDLEAIVRSELVEKSGPKTFNVPYLCRILVAKSD